MVKYKPYQLRLPPEHIERMQEIAEARDVPVAQIYRSAVHAWLASRYPYGPKDDRPHVVTGRIEPTVPLATRPRTASAPECTTLGVSDETLNAHADAMEQSLGIRPDTVRRGDEERPIPRFGPDHPLRDYGKAKVKPSKGSTVEPRPKKGRK